MSWFGVQLFSRETVIIGIVGLMMPPLAKIGSEMKFMQLFLFIYLAFRAYRCFTYLCHLMMETVNPPAFAA